MKKTLQWILLSLAAVGSNTAFAVAQLEPLPQHALTAHLSARVLGQYHYKKISLDDASSARIFDAYLKSLDGDKMFFLQSDIDLFGKVRDTLDDAILAEDLGIPFAIFNIYQKRIAERIAYARSLLKDGFDFEQQENYQYLRDNASWSQSEAELNDLWRKRVKSEWLRLKLAGKNKQGIVETLEKRYDNLQSRMSRLQSDDVFQGFMSAFLSAMDPHTDYFGKRAAEDFDISMKLSLVGIGAVLQEKDEYATIRELVAGGPAALSGKLKVGDRIAGVGQGEGSVPTEVMGWRINDTVALIRGKEDTVVVLDVLPAEAGPDGKHQRISLLRKKISLDEQAAKKSIIESKAGRATRRIGVISLPGFYQDFAARQKGDKEFRSATRDVSRLLGELKKDKVDSVLIDLRNNGGGSLSEAIELTGLFIDKGPVVQQRDAKGEITVSSDTRAGVAWDGPVGVLINRASASASEIFAAAIQDYGRGIIIGEPSFGKGTVQTVVDLNELVKTAQPEFGELKFTVAQFFRINGGTTQLRGVTPDISLPSLIDTDEFGEASYDNALPWAQIGAADYKPVGDVARLLPKLKAQHETRVAGSRDFRYLLQDIEEFSTQRKRGLISLNEAERRKEREVQEARIKAREHDGATDKNASPTRHAKLADDGLLGNERNLATDIAIENARKNNKDVLLNEAANILGDEVVLRRANRKLSSIAQPQTTH